MENVPPHIGVCLQAAQQFSPAFIRQCSPQTPFHIRCLSPENTCNSSLHMIISFSNKNQGHPHLLFSSGSILSPLDPESEEGEGHLSSEPGPFCHPQLRPPCSLSQGSCVCIIFFSGVWTSSQTIMLLGIYSSLLTWEKHSFGSNIRSSSSIQ